MQTIRVNMTPYKRPPFQVDSAVMHGSLIHGLDVGVKCTRILVGVPQVKVALVSIGLGICAI